MHKRGENPLVDETVDKIQAILDDAGLELWACSCCDGINLRDSRQRCLADYLFQSG